jgi:hypothetical protein
MLRPIYVVRSNHAPERHLRKREGHQLTCLCQSKACAVDVNAHLGVPTAQGVENKGLQTKWGVLLIVYMLSQRLRLIGQAITSDAAYSAALHKAWFVACIASACSSYALLGTTSAAIKARSLACIAKPAAHTHSLAPLGPACADPDVAVSSADSSGCSAVVLRPERRARVVSESGVFLHIPAVETRTRQASKAPRRMGSHLFRVAFAGFGITLPSRSSVPNNCAFCAIR